MIHPMLNVAIKAARKGAAIIRQAFVQIDSIPVEKKDNKSLVTQVDRAAEAAIIEVILAAYPDHGIVAEESGELTGKETDYQWVIDPLDGTTNFIHGHPNYSVSIGLNYQRHCQQAVVYDITRNHLFTAIKGGGAYLDDRRIHVAKRRLFETCLLSTSAPIYNPKTLDLYLALLADIMALRISTRNEGSAALDLCRVAAGQTDGFFAFHLKPWDIAAGTLIVEEAGGIVTDIWGNSNFLETGHVVAANPKMLGQLLQLLSKHLAHQSID